MSRPVDVNATLTKAIDGVNMLLSPEHALWNLELREARAAVAELVRHADTLATAVSNLIAARTISDEYSPYVTDVTAALAKLGGQP